MIRIVRRHPEIKSWSSVLIFALAVQFLLAVALTASPLLHERLHHDASNEHHECLATMLLSGGSDGSAVAPVISATFDLPPVFAFLAKLPSFEVVSIFLGAHVFEHAPPRLA